ncbi:MAG: hypothetical protein N2745_03545 [Syntrophorhabdaceae bacterium]|nr:hypothetical protein [Syntrophorhabdaceae bacterium]
METSLYMIGVIHRDEEGRDLLNRWLSTISPEVITLEFSKYGLAFRMEKGDTYKRKVMDVIDTLEGKHETYDKNALSFLLSSIEIPYEYDVASVYAKERHIPLYLIDMDVFSCLKLKKMEELFEERNIMDLLVGLKGMKNGKEKALARLFFEKGLRLVSYTDEMYIRDMYMSKKIEILMKHYKNRKFLHICGWQHLDDPYKLYERLNPVKVFVYDKAIRI